MHVPPTPASARRCMYCERGPRQVELRPYGKDGRPICSECMNASPERKAEAQRQLRARMNPLRPPLSSGPREPMAAPFDAASSPRPRTVPPTCAKCAQPIALGEPQADAEGRPVHAVCPDWVDELRADKRRKEEVVASEDLVAVSPFAGEDIAGELAD